MAFCTLLHLLSSSWKYPHKTMSHSSQSQAKCIYFALNNWKVSKGLTSLQKTKINNIAYTRNEISLFAVKQQRRQAPLEMESARLKHLYDEAEIIKTQLCAFDEKWCTVWCQVFTLKHTFTMWHNNDRVEEKELQPEGKLPSLRWSSSPEVQYWGCQSHLSCTCRFASVREHKAKKNVLVSIQYFGKCWHTVFAFLTNS